MILADGRGSIILDDVRLMGVDRCSGDGDAGLVRMNVDGRRWSMTHGGEWWMIRLFDAGWKRQENVG